MKYIFGLLSLFFFFRVENSSVQICKGIKNGTFITIDKRVGETIIQRNDSIQLEQNETLGIKYLEKIKWINNCSYEVYDLVVVENKQKLRTPSGTFIISLEQLNDSVYNQTTLIEKFNYKHSNKITKISNNTNEEFKRILAKQK